ncbi:DUF4199 domain-containing protein [Maritalea mediterranea]|uniref:DUF4199 domain-containing protein n=1 Tax=Maritalea mediterranea TaxID=2909667 RepID=A0ABS9E3B7_9HYPH|nr:DUF4199 domain-containing protein [Maritalea mediterranea]MCF4097307.1 DUF4199 domain-containing protein [Maritalea mediterranea]
MQSIIKWGVIVGAVMTLFMLGSYIVVAGNQAENMGMAEMAGYVGMIAALAIILFAMHQQFNARADKQSLWQRIIFGMGIAFVAGVIFAICDVIYTFMINPDFMDAYFQYYLSTLPVQEGPEYERMVEDAMAQREMFAQPVMVFLVMAATVWVIGLVVSVLGGLGHYFWTKTRQNKQAV